MKAVVFGPGRIGAGFIGPVLHRAGFQICFVGRSPSVVSALAERSSYQVRVVWYGEEELHTVAGVKALSITESAAVATAIREADLVVTAVGSNRLREVAPLLAAGLCARSEPVTVLACENLVDPGAELARAVAAAAGTPDRVASHSFAGALVCHAVTHRLGGRGEEPFTFVSEPLLPCHVDSRRLAMPLPDLVGMDLTTDFGAAVRRKLYTYSAGHAATAYLGHLKGYHFIHTAICDDEISRIVGEAIGEGQRGIAARYGDSGGDRERAEIITRFGNPGLADPIIRVGREPGRKLGSEDRLVGAARLAERAGIVPAHLALAAAAALCFANPSDPTSLRLLAEIDTAGLGQCLSRVCGLDPERELGMLLGERWRELSRGWQPGNLLLSIDRLLWATETGSRR